MSELVYTPYGTFDVIEWDMRNYTDEYIELVCYVKVPDGWSDDEDDLGSEA